MSSLCFGVVIYKGLLPLQNMLKVYACFGNTTILDYIFTIVTYIIIIE